MYRPIKPRAYRSATTSRAPDDMHIHDGNSCHARRVEEGRRNGDERESGRRRRQRTLAAGRTGVLQALTAGEHPAPASRQRALFIAGRAERRRDKAGTVSAVVSSKQIRLKQTSETVCTDGRVPEKIRERVTDYGAGN